MFRKVFAHPRYFLGGHRPSETSILTSLDMESFFIPSAKDYSKHGNRVFPLSRTILKR
jgi:hypothetical protein